MPKKIHKALVKSARKKGLKGASKDKYIFGTLSKIKKRKKK